MTITSFPVNAKIEIKHCFNLYKVFYNCMQGHHFKTFLEKGWGGGGVSFDLVVCREEDVDTDIFLHIYFLISQSIY